MDGPASAPRTLIQSLNGLEKVNNELLSILFDPRITLPILDGVGETKGPSDIRRFFHEDRNQPLEAVRAINTTIKASSGSSLASFRCRCSTCNPKFDEIIPNAADWAFEVSFLPITQQRYLVPFPVSSQHNVPEPDRASHHGISPDMVTAPLRTSQIHSVDNMGEPERPGSPLVYLDDILQHREHIPTMDMPSRLALAFRLSTLVLQIASAPLTEDQGQFGEWAVAVRRTPKGVLLDPFVVVKQVSSDHALADRSPSSGRGWRSVSREPLLTKLGLTLAELVLGRSLTDIRSEQPGLLRKDEMEGYDSTLVDIFTVRRMLVLRRLEQTVSLRFQDVVSALVTHQYRDNHGGTVRNICSQDASFMEHAATAVLRPLYQEVRRSLGYVTQPPPAKSTVRFN